MTELTEKVGFGATITEAAFSKRRRVGVELFATIALAISLIIAATAVSIGVARAQAIYVVARHVASPFGAAVRHAIRP